MLVLMYSTVTLKRWHCKDKEGQESGHVTEHLESETDCAQIVPALTDRKCPIVTQSS